MVALLVIAAFITALAGIFAVVTRQMAIAHRQNYREELALSKLSRAHEAESAAKRKAQQKLRVAAKRAKPIRRPAAGHGHSALFMR